MRSRVVQAASALALMTLWALAKYASLVTNVWKPNEYSDTYYYFTSAQAAMATANPLVTMTPEYPTPAAAMLLLPYVAGGTGWDEYRWNFLVLVVGVDALFVLLLAFRAGAAGVLLWTLLETVAGSLALLRLDIVPAVLGGAALLLVLRRQDAASSPLAAFGAGVKLWPALLLPLALGDRQRRPLAAVTGGVAALALVVLSLWAAGLDRLLSPLRYQSERGLQIESVAATPAMLARLDGRDVTVEFTKWHAYEITSADAEALLRLANVGGMVAVAALVLLYIRWFRSGASLDAAGYLALFAIASFMATSKALSPQYLLWLAAPAAVLFAWSFDPGRRPAVDWRAGLSLLWVLTLMVLTNYVYPTHYDEILMGTPRRPTVVLAARNLLLVGFAAWCALAALNARQPVIDAGT